MFDLPSDLIEEILSRVPATSLKRLRSTCKLWDALFKELRFTEKHFRKAAEQSMILMLKKSKVCSMSVNLNVAPPSIEFKGALDLKDSYSNSEEQVDIAYVFHCDGLLSCNTKDNRLVVWNPCTGETRWIQSKTAYKSFSKCALGYQNNKSYRSYKILRYQDGYPVLECEVYEFSSDSWRVLDNDDPNLDSGGVSLKGNAYWLAVDDQCLICFDFTRERFRRLCLPPSQNGWCTALSVVREEQLLVLRIYASKTEIWVTNRFNTEAALSWSKLFTVDYITAYGSLLIDEEKKVALCCNLEFNTIENKVYTIGEDDEYYTEIPYMDSTDKPWWVGESRKPCIFNYVPSLVQIHQETSL